MNGRIHRLLTCTCSVVRLISSPFHNSDKQPDLTGPTFAALTPLAALFDVVLAVLTPLGRDFVAQVAPTWAPRPSKVELSLQRGAKVTKNSISTKKRSGVHQVT